jgi:hypothetical protein
MLPIGTRVYDRNASPNIIGTILRPSRTFPNWVWVAWPARTLMVRLDTLKVA